MKLSRQKQSIHLGFYFDLGFISQEMSSNFLEMLFTLIPELAPQKMDTGRKWENIDQTNLSNVHHFLETHETMLMKRSQGIESEIAIVTRRIGKTPANIVWWVEEQYLENETNLDKFLNMGISIYNLLHADYGDIHQTEDSIEQSIVYDIRYGRTSIPVNLEKGLPGIYWANFFGRKYVENFGKEFLLNAPCHKIIGLSDGGVLMVTSKSPLNPNLEDNRQKQKKVREYIGEGKFYPKRIS
jgi:hypothetical protein